MEKEITYFHYPVAQDTHPIPNEADGGTKSRDGTKARPKRIRANINPAAPSSIWCLSTPCGNVSSQWLGEHHPYDLAGQNPHGFFLVLPLLAAWAFPRQVFPVPGIGIANVSAMAFPCSQFHTLPPLPGLPAVVLMLSHITWPPRSSFEVCVEVLITLSFLFSAYLQVWHPAADAKLCCSLRSVCLDCRAVESRGNDF